MEKISETGSDSSRSDRQNVSFKFTKKLSKAATGNKLEDARSNAQKDFVISLNENKIKSTVLQDKEKDLIIPMIKKNNWRTSPVTDSCQDDESKLKSLAVQELLKESKERNEQWDQRDPNDVNFQIPLILQNKVPKGYETDEKMDVSLRPDESKLDDYDRIPVENFGLAVLRGMGWKEGDAVGANAEKAAEPVQVQLRPKGLGLGADASALNKKKDNKKTDEKLELIKGAYVLINQGSNKGFYGQVLGLDEENGRAIVKISGDDKTVTFPEFSVEVVSKKIFEREKKVINRAKYEKYINEQAENEVSKSKSKRDERDRSSRHRENSKDRYTSRDEKKRSYDSYKETDSSEKESHSKKKSIDRSSESSKAYSHKSSSKPWVRPQLRVRLIDEKYKKGKYFNEKVVVIDVLSSKSCTCKTENGKYLEDISPSMLETVIPRSEPSYVMIVHGKYSGELCTILERNKSKCLATVQFLSDRDNALEVDYDSICEYVGDVSQYD